MIGGHPSHTKVWLFEGEKAVPLFLSYLKTLSIGPALGELNPRPSAYSQAFYRLN